MGGTPMSRFGCSRGVMSAQAGLTPLSTSHLLPTAPSLKLQLFYFPLVSLFLAADQAHHKLVVLTPLQSHHCFSSTSE